MTIGVVRIPFENIPPLLEHVRKAIDNAVPYRVFGSAALCSRSPTAVAFRHSLGHSDVDDLDVVVRRKHIEAASIALSNEGYVRGHEISPDFRRVEAQGARRCFVWKGTSEVQPHLLELWWEPIRVGECELSLDWVLDDGSSLLAVDDLLVFALQWPAFSTWSEPNLAKRLKRTLDVAALISDFPFDASAGISLDRLARVLSADRSLWRRAYRALPHIEAIYREYCDEREVNADTTLAQCERLRGILESRRIQGFWRILFGPIWRILPDFL